MVAVYYYLTPDYGVKYNANIEIQGIRSSYSTINSSYSSYHGTLGKECRVLRLNKKGHEPNNIEVTG